MGHWTKGEKKDGVSWRRIVTGSQGRVRPKGRTLMRAKPKKMIVRTEASAQDWSKSWRRDLVGRKSKQNLAKKKIGTRVYLWRGEETVSHLRKIGG